MKCKTVQKNISPLLDEEIKSDLMEQVRAHLQKCEICRSEQERFEATYDFINTTQEAPADPFMITRVKAQLHSKPTKRSAKVWAIAHKVVLACVVVVGVGIGVIIGVQLNVAMQTEQPPLVKNEQATMKIDANMFTATPSGSLTDSYITLTSASE